MSVDRIIKLVKLSESPVDAEALSAIRKAHELVRKNSLTWDSLFATIKQKSESPKSEEQETTSSEWETIPEMIEFIKEHAWSGFDTSFIMSLEKKHQRGRLTEKQFKALKNVYTTIKRGFNNAGTR